MRRQKHQIEPLCLQSPEQDLCEISMQIDQNQSVSNFMAPFVPPQKQLKFDGWVRVESKTDEKLVSHRSHIIENLTRPIKHQDSSLRYSPTRSCQKRSSLQESHSLLRAVKEEISLLRAQSQEMPRQFQAERQMYHSFYLNDSAINVRKGSGYTRETNINDRQVMTKMQVGTVNYPILELGGNDPQKKYMFHIGRVRRMININSKGKRK